MYPYKLSNYLCTLLDVFIAVPCVVLLEDVLLNALLGHRGGVTIGLHAADHRQVLGRVIIGTEATP